MYCPVVGKVHIKDPLLLINEESPMKWQQWVSSLIEMPEIKCVECVIK